MPDLSKINYNGTEYDIKDSVARSANQIVISAFQELKGFFISQGNTNQGNTTAIAILDQAILDLSALS